MRDDIQERTRERAYLLWERAGCPDGEDLSFWIEAERQITDEDDEDTLVGETLENPAVAPTTTILH